MRVVLAMSGGVDSSVAAFLLKERGFDVIGLFMRTGDHANSLDRRAKTCCSATDSLDARAVADRLDVDRPYFTVGENSDGGNGRGHPPGGVGASQFLGEPLEKLLRGLGVITADQEDAASLNNHVAGRYAPVLEVENTGIPEVPAKLSTTLVSISPARRWQLTTPVFRRSLP